MDKEKLALNLATLPKMFSAWWMTFSGSVAIWWLGLTPETQTELLAKLPWLPTWAYPILAIIIGLALRAWPQSNIAPTEAAGKSGTEEKQ